MFVQAERRERGGIAQIQRGVRPVAGQKIVGERVILADHQHVARRKQRSQLLQNRFRQTRLVAGADVDVGDQIAAEFVQAVQRAAKRVVRQSSQQLAGAGPQLSAGELRHGDVQPMLQTVDDVQQRADRRIASKGSQFRLVLFVELDRVINVPGVPGADERSLHGVVNAAGHAELRGRFVQLAAHDGPAVHHFPQKTGVLTNVKIRLLIFISLT